MSGFRDEIAMAICLVGCGIAAHRSDYYGEADAAILAFRQWMDAEGLKIVPKTPSQDQFRAGSTFRFTVETHGYKDTAGIYEAMIAAAPDPLGDGP
jgi:hypothetical protein